MYIINWLSHHEQTAQCFQITDNRDSLYARVESQAQTGLISNSFHTCLGLRVLMQTSGVEEREIRSGGYMVDCCLFCAFVSCLFTVHLSLFYIIRLPSCLCLHFLFLFVLLCVLSARSHTHSDKAPHYFTGFDFLLIIWQPFSDSQLMRFPFSLSPVPKQGQMVTGLVLMHCLCTHFE